MGAHEIKQLSELIFPGFYCFTMDSKEIAGTDNDGFAVPPVPKGGDVHRRQNKTEAPRNDSGEPLEKKSKNEDHQTYTDEAHRQDESCKSENEGSPTAGQSVKQVLEGLKHEADLMNTTWTQAFSECENYELLCPDRLDQMIQEAKELEQTLTQQKNALRERLGF